MCLILPSITQYNNAPLIIVIGTAHMYIHIYIQCIATNPFYRISNSVQGLSRQ